MDVATIHMYITFALHINSLKFIRKADPGFDNLGSKAIGESEKQLTGYIGLLDILIKLA